MFFVCIKKSLHININISKKTEDVDKIYGYIKRGKYNGNLSKIYSYEFLTLNL